MPKGIWKPLTSDDEKYITDHYLALPVKRIAAHLGITGGRVNRFLNKKGLVIPREIIEQRKLIGRKKKGDIPFNKGMKQSEYMSAQAIERTRKTRFKKGNVPHNTKYDGAEYRTEEGYLMYRVSLGNYVLKHRWIYEQHHGTIPEGYVIIFKDGDKNNMSLDNLKAISREENMLRNSITEVPEELIPSLALVNQIKNKIRNHGKEQTTAPK